MIKGANRLLTDRGSRLHLMTYAAEGLVLMGTVLVYKLAVIRFGQEGFEPYTVVRRTISFLQTVLLLGLAVALVRFVALAKDRKAQVALLRMATGPMLLVATVVLALFQVWPGALAGFVFGEAGMAPLARPIGLLTVGLLAHSLIYSFWRGSLEMGKANLLQVLNLAVVPNAAMWWAGSLAEALWWTAGAWTLSSVGGLLAVLLQRSGSAADVNRARLFRYGLPRVPGDLMLAALLTAPVYLVNHVDGLAAGAQVAFGLTLVNLAASVFSPISLLQLPQSAGLLANGRWKELETGLGRVARTALWAGVAMVLAFELLADPLLHVYLGDVGRSMVTACRVIFLAALPMAVFVALRSALDAYYTAPRNTFNLLAASLVFLAGGLLYWAWGILPAAWAGTVVVPFAALALFTWRSVAWMRRDLRSMGPKEGHKVRVLVIIPGSEGSAGMPFSHRQADALHAMPGFEVRKFILGSRTSPRQLLRAGRQLRAMADGFRPDVAHVHYGSVTALFSILTLRCPVVITFHGSDLNRTPSDGFWRDLLGRTFSQLAALGAAGIICVSPKLRERLWWRREDAGVIPIGTDTTEFKPMDRRQCREKLGWPAGPAVLFNAGNPALKRLDIAESALEKVRMELPDARLVTLRGNVDPAEMPLWVNAADLVLLCSDAEGSPTMVKEAMACNVPVVGTDVGDVAERVAGVKPGALVEQEPGAIAKAILEVLAENRPSNGRERLTEQGYTSEVLDRRVADLLRNCTWYRDR